jgi:hypothetical protein
MRFLLMLVGELELGGVRVGIDRREFVEDD